MKQFKMELVRFSVKTTAVEGMIISRVSENISVGKSILLQKAH